MSKTESQFGNESLEKEGEVMAPKTSMEVNLHPAYLKQAAALFWRVRVIGPAPLQEEGDPSEPAWFLNDGDLTLVQLMPKDNPGIHWLNFHEGQTTLNWAKVTAAQKYTVIIRPFDDAGNLLGEKYALEAPNPPGTSFPLDIALLKGKASANLKPGIDPHGYWWSVIAIGPEEIQGN
jgi:hypothetical protein